MKVSLLLISGLNIAMGFQNLARRNVFNMFALSVIKPSFLSRCNAINDKYSLNNTSNNYLKHIECKFLWEFEVYQGYQAS